MACSTTRVRALPKRPGRRRNRQESPAKTMISAYFLSRLLISRRTILSSRIRITTESKTKRILHRADKWKWLIRLIQRVVATHFKHRKVIPGKTSRSYCKLSAPTTPAISKTLPSYVSDTMAPCD